MPRTIDAALEHSNDQGWWAHPWNSNHDDDLDWNGTNWNGTSTIQDDIITSSSEETATSKQNDDKGVCGEQSDNEGATWHNETVYGISEQATSQQQQLEEEDIPTNIEAFASDRSFYHSFGGHLDGLIEAVCQKSSKEELRNLIADADNTISLQTGLLGQTWNLVNRLSYKHNQEEGRSPLAYAVAKNLKQQVYDLIDLGAEVSKVMPRPEETIPEQETTNSTSSDDNKESAPLPKTALVIAATNTKRDGTEMVRILFSKGACPEELTVAKVDVALLNRGMRYWIDKAQRVGIPPKEELEHMASLAPMDRIHELDYGVVGQEASVSSIQEALSAKFGNPSGSKGKPLGK